MRARRRTGLPLAAGWACAGIAVLGGCGGGPRLEGASTVELPTGPVPLLAQVPSLPRSLTLEHPFAADAVWNVPLARDVALDPESARLSGSVARMARDIGTALSYRGYGVPVYVVGPDQPRVRVVPDVRNPPLHEAFARVPIPPDAHPSSGTDAHLVVQQPSTDTMWEFWRMRREGGGWRCGYGGRMVDVSTNPGYFVDVFSPTGGKIELSYWGATATGLPLIGGLIVPEDLRRGRIDHALALALPRIRRGVRAFPAQRSDGRFAGPDAVPEGARFRVDPALDLDSLGLTAATLTIARAAQRYGMFVRDGGGRVALYGRDPVNLGRDPYPELLDGLRPYQLLRDFPWDSLQLVRMRTS